MSVALSNIESAVQNLDAFLNVCDKKVAAVKHLLEVEKTGPAWEFATEVQRLRTSKIFDYSCAIINLYGAYERFIESLLSEYLTELRNYTTQYTNLPEKLKNSHFELTLHHLQRTRDSRYSGRATSLDLAHSFHSCLHNDIPFVFHNESMLYHTSNFRPSVVDEFLNRASIEMASRRAIMTHGFLDYLRSLPTPLTPPPERPEGVLEAVINLVERRNQVAHGDIVDTLANQEIRAIAQATLAYCRALGEIVDDSLVTHIVTSCGHSLNNPINVFNKNIVCVYSQGWTIKPGDIIALGTVNSPLYKAARIENIQINNTDVPESPSGNNVAIGMKINGRAKVTNIVYYIQKPSI